MLRSSHSVNKASTFLSLPLSISKKEAAATGCPDGLKIRPQTFRACQCYHFSKGKSDLLRDNPSYTRYHLLELHDDERERVPDQVNQIVLHPIVASDKPKQLPALQPFQSDDGTHNISLPVEGELGAPAYGMLSLGKCPQTSCLHCLYCPKAIQENISKLAISRSTARPLQNPK